MELLNNNWKEFEQKVVKPVWRRFYSKYVAVGVEYDDFLGIAYVILNGELPKYKSEKSGIYTYSVDVLKKRMGDYIRNNYNTDKTRANFCPQSLSAPLSDGSDMTLEDSLVDTRSVYKPENNIGKIKRFMKTLSHRQKEILFLMTIGLDAEEIQTVLEISYDEYSREIQKIKSPRRISRLKNEVIKNGKKTRIV